MPIYWVWLNHADIFFLYNKNILITSVIEIFLSGFSNLLNFRPVIIHVFLHKHCFYLLVNECSFLHNSLYLIVFLWKREDTNSPSISIHVCLSCERSLNISLSHFRLEAKLDICLWLRPNGNMTKLLVKSSPFLLFVIQIKNGRLRLEKMRYYDFTQSSEWLKD